MERFPSLFLSWILLSFPLGLMSSPRMVAGNQDAELVQQLEELRLKTFAYRAEAQTAIDTLFTRLHPETTPRAWIKAYALASAATREQTKAPPFAQVIDQAKQVADPHLLAEVYLSQALQSRGDQAVETALQELKEARNAARTSGDNLLTGMILAETAYTYSILNNRPGGIQAIEEALAIMQGHPNHPHYLYAQSTLSILLYYLERSDEALRISKEVFAKFSAQKNYYSAALEACNIGLAYRQRDPHSAEAITYFDAAIELAGKSGDRDALAGALNGKAHAYLERKPKLAIPLLVEAIDIYQKAKDKIFETEAILTLAEAYLKAGDIRNARETISRVTSNPQLSVIYPELNLSLQSEIAAAEKNFEAAYKAHVDYHAHWRAKKETEETAELNKLASTLNFKLEEEKNRTLKVELGNQQLALEKAEKEKQLLVATLGFFLLIVAAMLWGLWQGYQIHQQKKLQQEIMDSVHEGILRFGADRRIAHPYSKHLELLLGQTALSGLSIVDALFPDPSEEKSMVEACLDAIIDEERAAWDFNAVHLPGEIHLRGRIVQLFWHPIPNLLGLTGHVMLVLRDISEQRNYELLLQNERQQRDLHNSHALELKKADVMQVERFIKRLQQSVQACLQDVPTRAMLLRKLHTWKGEARTHGLKGLAEEIHLLEDHWAQGTTAMSAADVTEHLTSFHTTVKDYVSLLEDSNLQGQVPRQLNLFSVASDLFFEARTRLQQEGIRWGEVKVIDGLELWNDDTADLVRTVLLHAISNSIDHGFIRASPVFRQAAQAAFEAGVRRVDSELIIDWCDNGQGIHWDKIQELARSKGMGNATREELVDVLFLDGISTADQLSLSSGRGVGLAAIKSICDDRGGKVMLLDRPQQTGACLEVRLPLDSTGKLAAPTILQNAS